MTLMTVMTDNEQTNMIECKKRKIKKIERNREPIIKKEKKIRRNQQWKCMNVCVYVCISVGLNVWVCVGLCVLEPRGIEGHGHGPT